MAKAHFDLVVDITDPQDFQNLTTGRRLHPVWGKIGDAMWSIGIFEDSHCQTQEQWAKDWTSTLNELQSKDREIDELRKANDKLRGIVASANRTAIQLEKLVRDSRALLPSRD